jgi:hypothetical protein
MSSILASNVVVPRRSTELFLPVSCPELRTHLSFTFHVLWTKIKSLWGQTAVSSQWLTGTGSAGSSQQYFCVNLLCPRLHYQYEILRCHENTTKANFISGHDCTEQTAMYVCISTHTNIRDVHEIAWCKPSDVCTDSCMISHQLQVHYRYHQIPYYSTKCYFTKVRNTWKSS